VIIPAFNEEKTLRQVTLEIRASLPEADILVVNDGSTDTTARVAEEAGVLLLEHPFNMGIGATMQTGFLYAFQNHYDAVVQIDGDGQHNPAFLPSLILPISEGLSNLVIGSRYLTDGGFKSTFLRQVGIRFFTVLIWALVRRVVTDPTSGYRAMDRKAFGLFSKEYPSDYPEVEALISAYKNGLTFLEVPTVMHQRQGGVSSIGILSALYYMVKVTLSVSIGFLRRKK